MIARWRIAVYAAAAVVVAPVAVVAAAALTPTAEVWRHLWATRLPEMLVSTVALLGLVGLGTLVLGAGLAWLVTAYRFPGRTAFAWLLALPLAMPAYVLGFVFMALLSYPGPVQSALRVLLGPDVWFPEVRSLGGAAIVLTLTLYPYVYLLARAALTEQAAPTFEAARALGSSRLGAARRVVLPLARPSLAAGLTLVAMETLTDFATVQYFNVQTVSVGVYRVWKGMMDRSAATELAALVLVFALAVIGLERLLRGRVRFWQQGRGRQAIEAAELRGWRRWAATGACGAVLGAAFVAPVAQLVTWSGADTVRGVAGAVDTRYLTYFGNSLLLAGLAAALCVGLALLVTNAARFDGGRTTGVAAQLVTVGYAVPGPVVAIGTLVLLVGAGRALESVGLGWLLPGGTGLLATGTLTGLVYAYVVRFMALAYNGVDASLQKVSPSMTMSARTLGAAPAAVLWRVHLPLVRTGAGAALVLVTLDALKELPIVLLLRPFGFETLSVWVWQLAADSRFEAAALPALTIVAASLAPVLTLVRARSRAPSPLPVPAGGTA